MKEQAIAFGPGRKLVGVLTDPPAESRKEGRPAFIYLNSGVLHRVGPNRLSVTLARETAAQGFLSFRFDLSGIGDSQTIGGSESLMQRFVRETREAMDFIRAARNVDRFVLLGNCSGAGVAYLTALEDPRVVGTAMINPQGHRVSGYFLRLMRNPKSWSRFFGGVSRSESVKEFMGTIVPGEEGAGSAKRDLKAEVNKLLDSERENLLVFCEWDPGLDYFKKFHGDRLKTLQAKGAFHVIPGLNHDFDLVAGQRDLRSIVRKWSERLL